MFNITKAPHYNDIKDTFQNFTISSERDNNNGNTQNQALRLLQTEVLSAIDKVCEKKKRHDIDYIYKNSMKTTV